MKVFHHSNFLWTTLRLGLWKIGTDIGSGLLEFIRKCFICSELTISNRKWIWFSIYRPLNSQNLVHFFNELSDSLSKGNESYENFIVMRDFNKDIGTSDSDRDKLEQFYSLYNLPPLIKKLIHFV